MVSPALLQHRQMILPCCQSPKTMDICFSYSSKWQFKFSAKKSTVVVFNESMKSYECAKRKWSLGAQPVSEDTSYTHLGIQINKACDVSGQATDICTRLKATSFSTTNIGAHYGDLHPLSSAIIYKSVVLQRALYGSETLYSMSQQQSLQIIESSQVLSQTYPGSANDITN